MSSGRRRGTRRREGGRGSRDVGCRVWSFLELGVRQDKIICGTNHLSSHRQGEASTPRLCFLKNEASCELKPMLYRPVGPMLYVLYMSRIVPAWQGYPTRAQHSRRRLRSAETDLDRKPPSLMSNPNHKYHAMMETKMLDKSPDSVSLIILSRGHRI